MAAEARSGTLFAERDGGVELLTSSNIIVENCTTISCFLGVSFTSTTNCTVIGSTFPACGYAGIYFNNANDNNSVINNFISNASSYGIRASYSDYVQILNNTLTDNNYGIFPDYGTFSNITGNYVTGSTYGIYLYYSSNNSVNPIIEFKGVRSSCPTLARNSDFN